MLDISIKSNQLFAEKFYANHIPSTGADNGYMKKLVKNGGASPQITMVDIFK